MSEVLFFFLCGVLSLKTYEVSVGETADEGK